MKSEKFSGMMRVVQFNWPLYLVAAFIATLLAVISFTHSIDASMRIVCGVATVLIIAQIIASLVVSHLVYDLSSFSNWQWLKEITTIEKPRILLIHAGYDETNNVLPGIFSTSEVVTVDFYDALEAKEPSIKKARELYPSALIPTCTTLSNWPINDASIDLALLAFAAHEITDREQRLLLFREIRRVLSNQGQALLIEHLRDMPNFMAFGFGCFHFLPRSEWLRCARLSSLTVKRQYKITPFVGVFSLCP
ncbi:MAG: methyltransferase domain-containing protein [Candidatus Obscuribacterales bacterium]|nr:methyltransferase domain-containing protein [Candidatus Obscuribacterales bacterium]